MRLKFKELPAHLLPRSEAVPGIRDESTAIAQQFVATVLERWRGATTSERSTQEEGDQEDSAEESHGGRSSLSEPRASASGRSRF